LNRRQEQTDKHTDDGDHDKEFNKCECFFMEGTIFHDWKLTSIKDEFRREFDAVRLQMGIGDALNDCR
jgi:hypothetical protein